MDLRVEIRKAAWYNIYQLIFEKKVALFNRKTDNLFYPFFARYLAATFSRLKPLLKLIFLLYRGNNKQGMKQDNTKKKPAKFLALAYLPRVLTVFEAPHNSFLYLSLGSLCSAAMPGNPRRKALVPFLVTSWGVPRSDTKKPAQISA